METASAVGFLDADSTRPTMPNPVQDHSPALPPSEHFLDADYNIEVLACILFDTFLPVTFLDVLHDVLLNHISSVESLIVDFSGFLGTVNLLNSQYI